MSVLFNCGDITFQGGRDGGSVVAAVLEKWGVEELDTFVASHYDADHIGRLIMGVSSIHGSSFVLGPDGAPGSPGEAMMMGMVRQTGSILMSLSIQIQRSWERVMTCRSRWWSIAASSAYRGPRQSKSTLGMANEIGNRVSIDMQHEVDDFSIDLGGGAQMICLAANGFVRDRAARVANVDTENERSLCFLIRFGGFDYMLGGDKIGQSFGSENARVEGAIADWVEANGINIDVLHVNHHGADNATAWEFLDGLHSEVAIISAGNDNDHGHPHFSVLRRLAMRDVRIYQTEWGATGGSFPGIVRRRQAICQGEIRPSPRNGKQTPCDRAQV